MEAKSYQIKYGDKDLIIKLDGLACQADSAVTAQWGETVVLATVVQADEPREGVDFLPLLVDYEERLYASGKISGSRFIKREGRPSDNAVLAARLIDRPLRPLFDKNFRNDIQIVITVLSFDMEHDPTVISIIAASAALMLSPAPFDGPVSAVRVARIDGEFKISPTDKELENSELDLVVASTQNKVIMLEARTKELDGPKVLEAIKLAHQANQELIKFQKELAKAVTKVKPEPIDKGLYQEMAQLIGQQIKEAVLVKKPDQQSQQLAQLKEQALIRFEGGYKQMDIKQAFDQLFQTEVRELILTQKKRPDGRPVDEIRPMNIKVGLLPRTHGSGLFCRGETQSLTIATLGAPGDEQFIDTMEEEGTKRYMHHYNFPPFSTGEVSPIRSASRREIGHGALAERALWPVLPSQEEFPYTIRLVSEILSSNGSSSMAATCGSSLALMDAGVPIKRAVAGIAIGLIAKESFDQLTADQIKSTDYQLLTDIQGIEDFGGDMDFKVAGSSRGITAIQMDTKLKGITLEMVTQALEAAKSARGQILAQMEKVIASPRKELSPYAPRIEKIMISPKKIGEVIGPGGKTIRKIIEECGGKEIISIDIEDSGLVLISSTDFQASEKAKKMVEELTYELEVGAIHQGKVLEIIKDRMSAKEIGALVEIVPGKVGMVHISEISAQRVPSVSAVLKIGQQVKVKVVKVDEAQGRYGLSIKQLTER